MSYIDAWNRLWEKRSGVVKYGKVTAISIGDNVTIKYGARTYYSKYDKISFPDLETGDQVAFLTESGSPQNTFILRKAAMKYIEVAVNHIID